MSSAPPGRTPRSRGAPDTVRSWLVDTNAALLPFRERFPLEREFARVAPGAELVIPTSVLGELGRLQKEAVPGSSAALEWCRRFRSAETSGRGDLAILELALELRAGVITADEDFLRRLGSAGVPVLRPRGGSRLELYRPSGNR